MLDTNSPPRTRFFRGLQSLDVSIEPPGTLAPPENIPGGFEAVVQFDSRLLQRQLRSTLVAAGAAELTSRVLYSADGFPEALQAAVATLVRPIDVALVLETYIEIRITAPRLLSVRRGVGPVDAGDLVLDTDFTIAELPGGNESGATEGEDERPIEIEWLLELNLLRLLLESGGLSQGSGASGGGNSTGTVGGSIVGSLNDLSVTTTDPGGRPANAPDTREVRNPLGTGRVVTRMPTHLLTRDDLMQAWVELGVAQARSTVFSDDRPLTKLLAVPRGNDLLQSALGMLTSRSGLRLTPRVSIAGKANPQQIAAMKLGPMFVKRLIDTIPDGRDVLSLCFNFGGKAGFVGTHVKSFLGSDHFAYYVAMRIVMPVLQMRWRMKPEALEFAGDVPVELPLDEESKETGEGRARLRMRLSNNLSFVGLMAVEGVPGHVQDDVLRLFCTQDVHLLRLWWPSGEEIEDLGELGEPMTLPFVVNNQLFAEPDVDEVIVAPFRKFLAFVLEPLARPLVEPFEIGEISGLASEALGAIIVRASVPVRPRPDIGGANLGTGTVLGSRP